MERPSSDTVARALPLAQIKHLVFFDVYPADEEDSESVARALNDVDCCTIEQLSGQVIKAFPRCSHVDADQLVRQIERIYGIE